MTDWADRPAGRCLRCLCMLGEWEELQVAVADRTEWPYCREHYEERVAEVVAGLTDQR